MISNDSLVSPHPAVSGGLVLPRLRLFRSTWCNEVIYDENGVIIRSIPAIHAGDGPVSFIMEWNGYKLVYAGDTAPK